MSIYIYYVFEYDVCVMRSFNILIENIIEDQAITQLSWKIEHLWHVKMSAYFDLLCCHWLNTYGIPQHLLRWPIRFAKISSHLLFLCCSFNWRPKVCGVWQSGWLKWLYNSRIRCGHLITWTNATNELSRLIKISDHNWHRSTNVWLLLSMNNEYQYISS